MILLNNFNETNYPDTSDLRCIKVYIPDDDSFKAVLATLLQIPCQTASYEGLDASKVEALTQAWIDAYIETDWKECDVTLPIGAIVQFGASSLPAGWLYCNGDEKLKADYPALWNALGTLWGSPTLGSSYFVLPDFRNKSPYGYDYGSSPAHFTFGSTHGAENHTLSTSELPAHTHDYATTAASGSVGNDTVVSSGVFLNNRKQTSSVGSGSAHNNLHPVAVCGFIIYAGV